MIVQFARSRSPLRRRAPEAAAVVDNPSTDDDCRRFARYDIRRTRLRRSLATYQSRSPGTMRLRATGLRGSRPPVSPAFPASCCHPRIE